MRKKNLNIIYAAIVFQINILYWQHFLHGKRDMSGENVHCFSNYNNKSCVLLIAVYHVLHFLASLN